MSLHAIVSAAHPRIGADAAEPSNAIIRPVISDWVGEGINALLGRSHGEKNKNLPDVGFLHIYVVGFL